MLMREKLEIYPVWGKLQIKFPVRTKETEAIMVLLKEIFSLHLYGGTGKQNVFSWAEKVLGPKNEKLLL